MIKILFIVFLFISLNSFSQQQDSTSVNDTIYNAQLDCGVTYHDNSDNFIIYQGNVYFKDDYLVNLLFNNYTDVIWYILNQSGLIIERLEQMKYNANVK